LKLEEIDSIEIVGGSTRIPVVKSIIKEVFVKEPSTTLNQDEACSRGCTIMCAILSPTFKVKEFKIEECQLFPITLSWKGGFDDNNELEVFPHLEKIPLSKLLTIYKREPFEIEARYKNSKNAAAPISDARIGKLKYKMLTFKLIMLILFFMSSITVNKNTKFSKFSYFFKFC
jgi:molecular chaperone DnaK (HSP70)